MKHQNFTATITVERTPEEAFARINDVRGWWSGQIEGDTDKLGAEFTYSNRGVHRSVQKITELTPGKKVVWQVIDSHLSNLQNPSEWNGSEIVFEIFEKDGNTDVRFTHLGLVPEFECYGRCSNAWGMLIRRNLQQRIATGQSQPDVFA